MKKIYLILVAGLMCTVLPACARPADKVLASGKGVAIREKDFNAALQRLNPSLRAMVEKRKEDFLQNMINEQLLYNEALRRGLSNDKEVAALLAVARRQILVGKLAETVASGAAEPPAEDIKQYYEAHKEEFKVPERLHITHILVTTEQEAKNVQERLKKEEDFAAVAKAVSIDPSAPNGGDIGYFSRGQLIKDFETACFALSVNEISPIVKTQYGYHIIKILDRQGEHYQKAEDVKERIEAALKSQRGREKLTELLERLRKEADVKINEKF